jgi:hypothetical protein
LDGAENGADAGREALADKGFGDSSGFGQRCACNEDNADISAGYHETLPKRFSGGLEQARNVERTAERKQ